MATIHQDPSKYEPLLRGSGVSIVIVPSRQRTLLLITLSTTSPSLGRERNRKYNRKQIYFSTLPLYYVCNPFPYSFDIWDSWVHIADYKLNFGRNGKKIKYINSLGSPVPLCRPCLVILNISAIKVLVNVLIT